MCTLTTFTPTAIHIKRSTVLLPAEHGAWAQMIEALVLGLVVCGSWKSLWAGAIVLLLGLCTQPLKHLLKKATKPQQQARALAARNALAFLTPASVLLLGMGLFKGGLHPTFLIPLAIAAGLGTLQWLYTLNHQARDLPSVFLGVLAMTMVAPAMIFADSNAVALAMAAGLVFAARQFSTVYYTRYVLRHAKKHPTSRAVVVVVHVLGLLSLALLWRLLPGLGLAGGVVVLAYLMLCLRTGVVMSLVQRGRRFNPKRLGMAELGLAVGYALVVGAVLMQHHGLH